MKAHRSPILAMRFAALAGDPRKPLVLFPCRDVLAMIPVKIGGFRIKH